MIAFVSKGINVANAAFSKGVGNTYMTRNYTRQPMLLSADGGGLNRTDCQFDDCMFSK